jgi:hypothetical protein
MWTASRRRDELGNRVETLRLPVDYEPSNASLSMSTKSAGTDG